MENNFPNDATGDALKKFYDGGSDFKKIHKLEFIITDIDKDKIKLVYNELSSKFNKSEIKYNNQNELIISFRMLLKYNDIVKIEDELESIANKYNGVYDGWGGFEER